MEARTSSSIGGQAGREPQELNAYRGSMTTSRREIMKTKQVGLALAMCIVVGLLGTPMSVQSHELESPTQNADAETDSRAGAESVIEEPDGDERPDTRADTVFDQVTSATLVGYVSWIGAAVLAVSATLGPSSSAEDIAFVGFFFGGPVASSYFMVNRMGKRHYTSQRRGTLVGAVVAGGVAAAIGEFGHRTRKKPLAGVGFGGYPLFTAVGATVGYHLQNRRSHKSHQVRSEPPRLMPAAVVETFGEERTLGVGLYGRF